jgi:hypothetical protein
MDFTVLHMAVRERDPDTVKLLLDAGADPEVPSCDGDIPLSDAADAETVKMLVAAAPKTVHFRLAFDRTILMHLSCKMYANEVIEQLFASNSEYHVPIDVNDRDQYGDTALQLAMTAQNAEAVSILLLKGAEVMGSGWHDTTALMKPFLDYDNVRKYFADAITSFYPHSPEELDLKTQRCLELVLSQLHRKLTFPTMWTPRTSTVKRRDGGRGPPAKRRRR